MHSTKMKKGTQRETIISTTIILGVDNEETKTEKNTRMK